MLVIILSIITVVIAMIFTKFAILVYFESVITIFVFVAFVFLVVEVVGFFYLLFWLPPIKQS